MTELTSVNTSRGNSSILASFPVFLDFRTVIDGPGSEDIQNVLVTLRHLKS